MTSVFRYCLVKLSPWKFLTSLKISWLQEECKNFKNNKSWNSSKIKWSQTPLWRLSLNHTRVRSSFWSTLRICRQSERKIWLNSRSPRCIKRSSKIKTTSRTMRIRHKRWPLMASLLLVSHLISRSSLKIFPSGRSHRSLSDSWKDSITWRAIRGQKTICTRRYFKCSNSIRISTVSHKLDLGHYTIILTELISDLTVNLIL